VRSFVRLGAGIVCGFLVGVSTGAAEPKVPGAQMTVEQIKTGAPAVHPATLYLLAKQLFERGERDEAVFWFYVGQLRYRFYLEANPHIDPTGDPALFSSLSEVIGLPINQYAFKNTAELVKTLGRVGEWDEKNPNGFTSKENNHAVWLQVRQGFQKFIEDVKARG